ncbi:MAG: hypothetical protein Kow00117_04850 [Phototrophicales bacterium]
MSQNKSRIDRLLDAIELIKIKQLDEARQLLRELIREDNNFEDAWLWMAVTVDSIDQSSLCLDNVLRINPHNTIAAGALYRLKETEMLIEKQRHKLRAIRDTALGAMWILTLILLNMMFFSFFS